MCITIPITMSQTPTKKQTLAQILDKCDKVRLKEVIENLCKKDDGLELKVKRELVAIRKRNESLRVGEYFDADE